MWNKVKKFLLDWVWQLPQNLLGLGYKVVVYEYIIEEWDIAQGGYRLILKESNGGITLGKYIFVYEKFNNYVVKHETGHVKQSLYLGPLYLLVIGLPSILWASTHRWLAPKKDYYWFYTEAWANKLAGI